MRAILRFFLGEDVFISYSRLDGLPYATALANELTARGLTCRIDQYDTSPGAEIPPKLIRSLRWSRMMVLVASPAAIRSDRVREEIEEFQRAGARQLVVVTPVDREIYEQARWFPLVEGLPVNAEAAGAVEKGTPSAEVVDLVQNSFQFRTRNQRLRLSAAATIALIVVMIGVGWWLLDNIRQELEAASAERDAVQRDLELVSTQRDEIEEERKKLTEENAKQRGEIEVAAAELEEVRDRVRVERAEVERQTRMSAAVRVLGEADLRRQARGYTSPADLIAALRASATLASQGRGAEAQAFLLDTLSHQPRLVAELDVGARFSEAGILAGGSRMVATGPQGGVWDLGTSPPGFEPLTEDSVGLAISGDGRRFLTVTRGGEVRVRDALDPSHVRELVCNNPRDPYRFALSWDGSTAALVCGRKILIVDVETGQQISSFVQPSWVADLQLGPPDGYVAIVLNVGDDMDYRFKLYKLSTGEEVDPGPCASGFRTFTVDPTASWVANGCDTASMSTDTAYCQVSVCRLGTAEVRSQLATQARSTSEFSPDGSLLATAESGLIEIWRLSDGQRISTTERTFANPFELFFSGDGELLAGQAKNLVWLVRTGSGELDTVLELGSLCPSGGSCFIGVSANGQLVTGDRSTGKIQVWQSSSVHAPRAITFRGSANAVSFSPDGRQVVAAGRKVRGSSKTWYRIWNLATRIESPVSKAETHLPSGPGLERRGNKTVVDLGDRTVSFRHRGTAVVDEETGEEVFDERSSILALTGSGMVVTGEYGRVRIWRLTDGELLGQVLVPGQPAAAALEPGEQQIAIAVGREVQVWTWPLEELTRRGCELAFLNRWVDEETRPELEKLCSLPRRGLEPVGLS